MRTSFVSPLFSSPRLFAGLFIAALFVGGVHAEVWSTETITSETTRVEVIGQVGFGFVGIPSSTNVVSETAIAGFQSTTESIRIYGRAQNQAWSMKSELQLPAHLESIVVGNTLVGFEPNPYSLWVTDGTSSGNAAMANFQSADTPPYSIVSGQSFYGMDVLAVAASPSTQTMAVLYGDAPTSDSVTPTVVTQTNGGAPVSTPLAITLPDDGDTVISSSLRYVSGKWNAALAVVTGSSVVVWKAAEDAAPVALPKILNSSIVAVALDASGVPWVVATSSDPYVRIFKYSNNAWVQVVQYLSLTYPSLSGFGAFGQVAMHINDQGVVAAVATNFSSSPVFVYYNPVKNLTSAGMVNFQSTGSSITISASYDLKVMPDGTVTFLRGLSFYRGGNLLDLAMVDVETVVPPPTPTPTPVPTPVPPLETPPDNAELATAYYNAGESAFEEYSAAGDYALAYFYGYSNFAQAAYYQNQPDSTAAWIGYYYNMAIAFNGYYANIGQPDYGLSLYYSNMAVMASLQENVSGYYLYTANSIYYYYVALDDYPAALRNYYLYMAAACYYAGSNEGYLYYMALVGTV